jgi:hypothetical protein
MGEVGVGFVKPAGVDGVWQVGRGACEGSIAERERRLRRRRISLDIAYVTPVWSRSGRGVRCGGVWCDRVERTRRKL